MADVRPNCEVMCDLHGDSASETLSTDTKDSEGEDSADDGKCLKPYVRKSYREHLIKCIRQNYNVYVGIPEGAEYSYPPELVKVASYLEYKALRSSMVTSIYQQCMATLISNIKNFSKEKKPYKNLVEKLNKLRRKKTNKETQTDLETGPEVTQAEKIPERKDTHAKARVIRLKSSKDVKTGGPFSNISNIPSNSELDEEIRTLALGLDSATANGKRGNEENIAEVSPPKRAYVSNSEKPRTDVTPASRSSLEKRLVEFENAFRLNHHKSPGSRTNTPESEGARQENSLEWKAEMIAQTANLKRMLLSKSPEKMRTIQKRFKDLFGGEDEVVSAPTPREINKCRKRAAAMVARGLTRYYHDRRIGSKDVFKHIAKAVTTSILEKTLAPDITSIKKTLINLFRDGKTFLFITDVPEALEV